MWMKHCMHRQLPNAFVAIFILSLIGILWSNNYRITYSNHNYRLPFLADVPSGKFIVKLANSTSFMKRMESAWVHDSRSVLSDKFFVKMANSTRFIKRMESDWVHDSLRVTIERLNRWREPSPHWSHHDAMSKELILAITSLELTDVAEMVTAGKCVG